MKEDKEKKRKLKIKNINKKGRTNELKRKCNMKVDSLMDSH